MLERVLLVGGDRANRSVLRGVLRMLGGVARVEAAGDGARAVALAGSGTAPELIVLDLALPGMGGLECLVQMQRRAGAAIGAIVVCDPADANARERALAARGVLDVLDKPLHAAQVRAALERHFGLTLLEALAAGPASRRPWPRSSESGLR